MLQAFNEPGSLEKLTGGAGLESVEWDEGDIVRVVGLGLRLVDFGFDCTRTSCDTFVIYIYYHELTYKSPPTSIMNNIICHDLTLSCCSKYPCTLILDRILYNFLRKH